MSASRLEYSECKGINPYDLNNDICSRYSIANVLNTKECGLEGGSCDEVNAEMCWKTYPNCTGVHPDDLNNGHAAGMEVVAMRR